MDVKVACAEHEWVLREVLFEDFGMARDEECSTCGSVRVRAYGHVYE